MECLPKFWISYNVFKTKQPEPELSVEVSTQVYIFHILHSNFISYPGYLCETGSSSNSRHRVFNHERWMSCTTSLLYYSHVNPRRAHSVRSADCSSLQNSGRQSAILGRRTSSLEQSSKRNRNCENSALLTRTSKLTYSARTWTSQPLTHLRMWSRTEYWHCINLFLLSPVFWVLFLCVSAIWSTISRRTGTSRIFLWPYNW